jgi:hypothetical protein
MVCWEGKGEEVWGMVERVGMESEGVTTEKSLRQSLKAVAVVDAYKWLCSAACHIVADREAGIR